MKITNKKEGEILYDIKKLYIEDCKTKDSSKIIEIKDAVQEKSINIQNKGVLQKVPDLDKMKIEINEKKKPPNKPHKIKIEEMGKSGKKQKEIIKNNEYNPNINIIHSPNKNSSEKPKSLKKMKQ